MHFFYGASTRNKYDERETLRRLIRNMLRTITDQISKWWMIRNRWIIKLLRLLAFATVDEIKKFDRTETASFDPVSMFSHQRDFELGDHQLSDTLVVVYKISYNRLISSILKHAIQMLKATNGFYLLLIFLLIILPFYLLSLRLFTLPQTSFIT